MGAEQSSKYAQRNKNMPFDTTIEDSRHQPHSRYCKSGIMEEPDFISKFYRFIPRWENANKFPQWKKPIKFVQDITNFYRCATLIKSVEQNHTTLVARVIRQV